MPHSRRAYRLIVLVFRYPELADLGEKSAHALLHLPRSGAVQQQKKPLIAPHAEQLIGAHLLVQSFFDVAQKGIETLQPVKIFDGGGIVNVQHNQGLGVGGELGGHLLQKESPVVGPGDGVEIGQFAHGAVVLAHHPVDVEGEQDHQQENHEEGDALQVEPLAQVGDQDTLGHHAHDVPVVDAHGNQRHLVQGALVGQAQKCGFVHGEGAQDGLLQFVAEGGGVEDAAGVLPDKIGLIAHHKLALRVYDMGVDLAVEQQAWAEQLLQCIGVVGDGEYPDHRAVHTALVDGHRVTVHIAAQGIVPEGEGNVALTGQCPLHGGILAQVLLQLRAAVQQNKAALTAGIHHAHAQKFVRGVYHIQLIQKSWVMQLLLRIETVGGIVADERGEGDQSLQVALDMGVYDVAGGFRRGLQRVRGLLVLYLRTVAGEDIERDGERDTDRQNQ